MNSSNIRNFVIIAHIDHGKSTLADRMLEITNTVAQNKMHPQMLDTMELEQERGITIKLQPVTMAYRISHIAYRETQLPNDNKPLAINDSPIGEASDKQDSVYTLNLIDTPGHVDFSYEVSRSLTAVEGAVLVVDATKGIQAQTLANLHHAQKNNLVIIPVINKIDMVNAEVERVTGEIVDLLKIDPSEIILCSAKTGEGVEKILENIIKLIPPPVAEVGKPFKALIFDSVYDAYRGVIAYVRVMDGQIKRGDKLKLLSNKKTSDVVEVGEFKLKYEAMQELGAGQIGYIVTGEKNIAEVKVGDTIVLDSPSEVSPIEGFKIPKAMVFASIYPSDGNLPHLRTSLEKLKLNDSSLNYVPENSQSFGVGYRCGFLGLLHLEIIKERLEREYDLDLIVTQPTVEYNTKQVGGQIQYEEPWVALEIVTPNEYLGGIMELAQNRRAIYKNTHYLGDMTILEYDAPLSEIIVDFYDKLKSISSGYASQNYELIGWREGDLVKLEVLIGGNLVEEFGSIVPRSRCQVEAKNLALKLKNLIPKQMFEVSIQVTISTGTCLKAGQAGKIIARENVPAMKKDVTAKLYGGDVTRKNKLLKKQVAGKKRLKKIGKIDIPSSIFIEILKS